LTPRSFSFSSSSFCANCSLEAAPPHKKRKLKEKQRRHRREVKLSSNDRYHYHTHKKGTVFSGEVFQEVWLVGFTKHIYAYTSAQVVCRGRKKATKEDIYKHEPPTNNGTATMKREKGKENED
jgi:hypothetical protein